MLDQIDMRDRQDGYIHYRYRNKRDGTMFAVKVDHEADRILLNEVEKEKLRQHGISAWSYVLRFVNERMSKGWKPGANGSVVLTKSDAECLVGIKKQVLTEETEHGEREI
ncbi:MAG: hypothetical protein WCA49_17370 [Candidatus Sulfotelmatobacter sp.]